MGSRGAPLSRSAAQVTNLARVWCIALLACAPWACAPAGPNASEEEIARAKQVYTECVEEELGIRVETLDIRSNGDINVDFGEGYTEEGGARASAVGEPRIASVLEQGGASVLGPPGNLGRLGSDEDLDTLLGSRARLGFQGAILAELHGARRVSAGFGELALGSKRAPDVDTAFDCGSIMKEVTLATLFVLEEDGAIAREQPLVDFFQAAPVSYTHLTLPTN